jgi:hypothetical protein
MPISLFAGDDQYCQHSYQAILQHGVVIHDDGHHAHIWQEPAGRHISTGKRKQARVVFASTLLQVGHPTASFGPKPAYKLLLAYLHK